MKIEIGESLLLSWLRHVKNCQLVQTNWKPSVYSWELHNESEVEELMKVSAEYFKGKHGINLFKNNTSFMQLLQQAEIDVIGNSLSSDGNQELYAIDVAFHEAGLNYGDKNETVARVLKKMIRTAMVILGFFDQKEGKIIFASPKINNATFEVLVPLLEELKGLLFEKGYGFKLLLYCNDNFNKKVLQPVISASGSVADTSELFMRSLQLYNMFASQSIASRTAIARTSTKTSGLQKIEVLSHEGFSEMKIGLLVRSSLRRLFSDGKIGMDEVKRMTTYEYSKDVFNINYPLLKMIDRTLPLSEQRMVNNRPRYWNEVFNIQSEDYYVCQEWFEQNNRSYFMRWLDGVEKVE